MKKTALLRIHTRIHAKSKTAPQLDLHPKLFVTGYNGVDFSNSKELNTLYRIIKTHLHTTKVSILEVGCGDGRVGCLLYDKFRKRYLGVETNSDSWRLFKEKRPKANVLLQSIFDTEGNFDVVFVPYALLVQFDLVTQKKLLVKIASLSTLLIVDTEFFGNIDLVGTFDAGLGEDIEYSYSAAFPTKRRLKAHAMKYRLRMKELKYLFAESKDRDEYGKTRKAIHSFVIFST